MRKITDRMRADADVLLKLVKAAVNGAVDSVLSSFVDWDKVFVLAKRLGVASIAADGMQKYSDAGFSLLCGNDAQSFRKLKMKWTSYVVSNELSYEKHKDAVGSLAGFYEGIGVKMMLLKGYGLSLNYPVPEHRPAGDIDIYNFGDWRNADKMVTEKLGISIDYSHHHHSVFRYRGQMVENHYDILNVHAHKGSREIDAILKKMAQKDSRETSVDGHTLFLPSPDFNALFLMRHMGSHFAAESINIRHLLDWALFVRRFGPEIDWDAVLSDAESFGLERFMSCINGICVDKLGFDATFFPRLSRDFEMEQRVFGDILYPEFPGKEPSDPIGRTIFKYRRWVSNIWKHKLVYQEKLLPMFITLTLSHLKSPEIF